MTTPDQEPTTQLPGRVKINEAVAFQELEGETVLLNLENSFYYSLDDVGTTTWRLLTDQPDPELVVAKLLERYDIDEATVRRDLSAFMTQLAAAGLVVVESN